MNVFAKIFAQIFDSSISTDYAVRHVFMDLLVLADRDGVVDMTLDAISRRTNVPEEIVAHAIAELMKADRKSRSHQEEGRRITPIDSHRDWGWQIVNYEHYRNIKDEEARRTYFRDKKREQRAGQSKTVQVGPNSPQVSNLVKDIPTKSNNVTQGEGEGEGDLKTSSPKPRRRVSEVSKEPKHSSDPRHMACKEQIFAYYRHFNEGKEPSWDGQEGKALGMLLGSDPKLDADTVRKCLGHRAKSEVNHAERPSLWIQKITGYRNGPLDRFNKPKSHTNGAPAPKEKTDYERKVEQIMAEQRAAR